MSKKEGNRFLAIVLSVFGVFVLGTVLFLTLFLMARGEAKTAEQQCAVLETELEALRVEAAALEAELQQAAEALEESGQTAASERSDAAEAREKLEALQQELEHAKAELEVLRLAALPDVGELPAGTVLQPSRVDRNELQHYFRSYEIAEGDAVYQRIIGKSYVENPDIGLHELRYLKLLHYNFSHEIQVGELIVHAELAEDCLEIFRKLFEQEYEIYSMYLIEEFWEGTGNKSDTASCDANNSSAFCYRPITGGGELSNHAYGRAIDINPQQNPYVSYRYGYPTWHHDNADDYIDRDTGYAHMITHADLCFQLFTEYGFTWGGDWELVKDYQHFEKEP